jgi:hypothetical protein
MSHSVHLPNAIMKLPMSTRQQTSELYSALCAIKLILKFKIPLPTFVMDSSNTLATLLKGSSCLSWSRCSTLAKLQFLINKHLLTIQLADIDSKHNPADIPSRSYLPHQPVNADITKKLQFLHLHPGYINCLPTTPLPVIDSSTDAWATPDWLRQLILDSPIPPTVDLFADHSNSLCSLYFTNTKPANFSIVSQHTCFFQPPYSSIQESWESFLPFLPSQSSFWGLIPASFFHSFIVPHFTHICFSNLHVDYSHVEFPIPPGAHFSSILFFIPACLDQCVCSYLHSH